MHVKELEAAVLRLKPMERARLAEKLLHSLNDLSDAEIEQMWVAEAQRRDEDLRIGRATERSAEDVFRAVRARL